MTAKRNVNFQTHLYESGEMKTYFKEIGSRTFGHILPFGKTPKGKRETFLMECSDETEI